MGEAKRRKELNLPPRERVAVSEEELRERVRASVAKAISNVDFMWRDMNKPRASKRA